MTTRFEIPHVGARSLLRTLSDWKDPVKANSPFVTDKKFGDWNVKSRKQVKDLDPVICCHSVGQFEFSVFIVTFPITYQQKSKYFNKNPRPMGKV